MTAENVTYRTYDECLNNLVKLGTDRAEAVELLDHERAHFRKSIDLGYAPLYGICMIVDAPPVIIAGFIDFEGRVPQGQDMIDILLAPKNPGADDLSLVEKIRAEIALKPF